MAPNAEIPKVVILGCGYAGINLAAALRPQVEKGAISLTMLERKQFFAHKVAAVRAVVLGGEWVDRVLIPIQGACPKANIVFGDIQKVHSSPNKIVKIKDPNDQIQDIPYDILVCATGSLNTAPAELPSHVRTVEDAKNFFASVRDAIHKAENILLVGGGPVSLELAAEIRDAYDFDPQGRKDAFKSLTVVTAGDEIFSSTVEHLKPAFFRELKKKLEDLEVNVQLQKRVVKPALRDFSHTFFEGDQTVTFSDGSQRDCDLLVFCAGWSLNNSMYPKEWLIANGEIDARPTFQIRDHEDVFVFGDLASHLQTKLEYYTSTQAPLVARNIMKVARELKTMNAKSIKDPAEVKKRLSRLRLETLRPSTTATMIVCLGPMCGVSQTSGQVVGSMMTRFLKCNDRFTTKYFTLCGLKPPAAKVRLINFRTPANKSLGNHASHGRSQLELSTANELEKDSHENDHRRMQSVS